MYQCKELKNKEFETRAEMLRDLQKNKSSIIAQKKMQTKVSDTVTGILAGGTTIKAQQEGDTLTAKLVINTTNIMDSHGDVHLKGIWKKSLKEKKDFYLLQEHKMAFDSIITDDVKASAELISWKDLGVGYSGDSEALIFDATIGKRNSFMFSQYAKGYVKNHSVGMRYVKIEMAIDSQDDWAKEEKATWDKYISEVVNQKQAELQGYFFAVTEAKIIEGSAVPIGSNTVTPILEIEPSKGTQKEAERSLQKEQKQFFINQM